MTKPIQFAPGSIVAALLPATCSAVEGLRYIAESPAQEHGGFHPKTVRIAKAALLQIEHMELMLRSVDAATTLEEARRRANKGLTQPNPELTNAAQMQPRPQPAQDGKGSFLMSKEPRLGAATCSALPWKSPDSAPKDGATQILGDFGYPWPQLAVFNLYNDQWCVVEMACSPMQAGPMDTSFETDTQNHDQLRRWMPMPKLPKRKQNTKLRDDGQKALTPRNR